MSHKPLRSVKRLRLEQPRRSSKSTDVKPDPKKIRPDTIQPNPSSSQSAPNLGALPSTSADNGVMSYLLVALAIGVTVWWYWSSSDSSGWVPSFQESDSKPPRRPTRSSKRAKRPKPARADSSEPLSEKSEEPSSEPAKESGWQKSADREASANVFASDTNHFEEYWICYAVAGVLLVVLLAVFSFLFCCKDNRRYRGRRRARRSSESKNRKSGRAQGRRSVRPPPKGTKWRSTQANIQSLRKWKAGRSRRQSRSGSRSRTRSRSRSKTNHRR